MKVFVRLMMLAALVTPAVAQAYVGPGAGLSALGSVIAFLGAILLVILGFLWYPIKRLIKRFRKSDEPESVSETQDDQ